MEEFVSKQNKNCMMKLNVYSYFCYNLQITCEKISYTTLTSKTAKNKEFLVISLKEDLIFAN